MNASHFIELAENEGILFELSMWALDNVTKQLQQFNDMGHYTQVSMNISASDITHVALLQKLIEMLDHDQLQAGTLILELTERELIKNATAALNLLIRLRVKGIKLSIDDFGMGHSSLSLLHKMPFSELKIDRSFVNNMQSDDEARAIVKTCIILGHHLNSIVVAEGVEMKKLGTCYALKDVIAHRVFILPNPCRDMKLIIGSIAIIASLFNQHSFKSHNYVKQAISMTTDTLRFLWGLCTKIRLSSLWNFGIWALIPSICKITAGKLLVLSVAYLPTCRINNNLTSHSHNIYL